MHTWHTRRRIINLFVSLFSQKQFICCILRDNLKQIIMEQSLKDKLLKLYALARRGVGGEKVNAEMFLNKLLAKHNLTIEDIDSETPKDRYYKYTTKSSEKIINQIICRVTNSHNIYGIKGYKETTSKVTDYQHVQILELIDFHLGKFAKEKLKFMKEFESAYIQKHQLYRSESFNEDRDPPTPEERAEIMRIANMQMMLNNDTYTKKLE